MKKIYKLLTTLSISFILVSCISSAPLTGRKQVKLVSDEALARKSSVEYSKFIEELKNKDLLINSTKNGRRLKVIGKKVSKAVEKYLSANGMSKRIQYLNWEFNLIKSEEINAFALPGGKIAFYDGIIPVLKTNSGIAFVMGHEIGHVIGGHHAEGASHQQIAGIASLLTQVATENNLVRGLVNDGLSIGLLKFNRTQEYEADKYGMIFMAMAGYNPSNAINAEKRMSDVSKNQSGSDFLSTHPSGYKRIQELKKFLPTAMKYYKK